MTNYFCFGQLSIFIAYYHDIIIVFCLAVLTFSASLQFLGAMKITVYRQTCLCGEFCWKMKKIDSGGRYPETGSPNELSSDSVWSSGQLKHCKKNLRHFQSARTGSGSGRTKCRLGPIFPGLTFAKCIWSTFPKCMEWSATILWTNKSSPSLPLKSSHLLNRAKYWEA